MKAIEFNALCAPGGTLHRLINHRNQEACYHYVSEQVTDRNIADYVLEEKLEPHHVYLLPKIHKMEK